ncbi:hypothetical protein BS47DRAFT_1389316 [Hydnum rufescens UP504]|uniref:Uncharacterized protein n=1 Tax=Hydnum rufescens UP504 TaxID=1448309 RepID=A0A9P6B6E3_9AGAM|nr:hypothetical protein BS47DRAFT_1389316 [Hydnum rufescens UP504]
MGRDTIAEGARDAASKKVAGGSSEGDQEAKGKQKSTPLSSAYINSESDNAVESDPSGPPSLSLCLCVTSAPPPPLIDLQGRLERSGLVIFDPASFDNTFNAYPDPEWNHGPQCRHDSAPSDFYPTTR